MGLLNEPDRRAKLICRGGCWRLSALGGRARACDTTVPYILSWSGRRTEPNLRICRDKSQIRGPSGLSAAGKPPLGQRALPETKKQIEI